MNGNGKPKVDPIEILKKHILGKYADVRMDKFLKMMEGSIKTMHENYSMSFSKIIIYQQYQIKVMIQVLEKLFHFMHQNEILTQEQFDELVAKITEEENAENRDGDRPGTEKQGEAGPGDPGDSQPVEQQQAGGDPGSPEDSTS